MSTCRRIRFIASAGTGKTHQVVRLYQALLFGRPYPSDGLALPGQATGSIFPGNVRIAPEQILMLTFTKNAAAEMRSRVTQAVEEELVSGDPGNEAFCWSLLRRLSAATISTIHSFAQQLLSAHTLHLGLAPNLVVLEEAEASDLRNTEVEAALKAALAGSNAALARDIETLCDGRGLPGIHAGILDTLRACSAWGLDLAQADPAALVAAPAPPRKTDFASLVKRLEQSRCQKSRKRDDTLAVLQQALRHLDESPAGADSLPNQLAAAANNALKQAKGPWGSTDDIKALREETFSVLTAAGSFSARTEATRLLVSFLTLARHAALRIQGRKRALGVLDFDDLLFQARDLVRARPDAVPDLKVIIVDEAQDNSRLQNDLIRLVQSAAGADIVLCGDTKQTIYGWRGADPNGLPAFARTLKLADVPLRISYRSQRGILDWVNDIFTRPVFGPEHYGENETLLPCSAAASLKGPSVELLLPEWEVHPDPKGSITIGKGEPKLRIALTRRDLAQLAEKDAGDPQWPEALERSAQAVALEARAVARRIRLLTAPGAGPGWHPPHVWNPSTGGWIGAPPGPYRFRDILILLRAGTLQEVYEQALQEEGIPFTTDGKGRGFFARQETLDVANLLSWLACPNDRLAWLGLLRSPFVALSDNAIALLEMDGSDLSNSAPQEAPGSPGLPAEGGEDNPPVLPWRTSAHTLLQHGLSTDADALRRATPILGRLRRLAGRTSAVELVREAVRLTGYDAVLAGTFHGVQRLANLQKLLTWLQTRERDETLNLQQTARRLNDEITGGREAPDAAVLDPDDDSVRINTIHAAKGLSSPVVFVPDLRRQPAADRDWILICRHDSGEVAGVAGKLKQFVDDACTDIASEQYDEALSRNKDDRDRESRRLFYVACTRARDLLVLSGENPYSGHKGAWRSWVNDHLKECDFDPRLITLRPYGDVERAWRAIAVPAAETPIPAPEVFATAGASASTTVPLERYRFPVTALTQAADVHNALVSLAPVSVTSSSADDRESPEPASDPMLAGTIAHRILETMDYHSAVPLETRIAASPVWNEVEAHTPELDRIRRQVVAAAATLSELLAGVPPGSIIRELPFAARFVHDNAEVIVDGKADLLFFRDGCWHLVDYKFSNQSPGELHARYAMQLQVYREALSAATDDPRLRTPRFACPDSTPAEWTLTLLAITDEGRCTPVTVEGPPSADLSATLVSAARQLSGRR